MSESWKNRLWSLLLVCTFAVVLSVCNKAINNSSGGSSSSGTAFADGSTVTISSLPFPKINALISCGARVFSSGVARFEYCDSSDNTIDSTGSITIEELTSSGFQPCGSIPARTDVSASSTGDGWLYGGHFFCK